MIVANSHRKVVIPPKLNLKLKSESEAKSHHLSWWWPDISDNCCVHLKSTSRDLYLKNQAGADPGQGSRNLLTSSPGKAVELESIRKSVS